MRRKRTEMSCVGLPGAYSPVGRSACLANHPLKPLSAGEPGSGIVTSTRFDMENDKSPAVVV